MSIARRKEKLDFPTRAKAKTLTLSFWKNKVQRIEDLMDSTELIGKTIHYKFSDKTLYKKGINKLKELLQCEMVRVYNVDSERMELVMEIPLSLHKNGEMQQIRYPINEHSLPGACAYFKTILSIADVSSELRYRWYDKEGKIKKCRNMLLGPLVFQGELLGVIQVMNSRHGEFTKEDRQFLKFLCQQMAINTQNNSLVNQLKEQMVQVCQAFADSITKKDHYTGGHTKRVGIFAEMIGKELNLPENEMHELKLAGIVHDIGKMGIADKILKKKAPLTNEELNIMREHPKLGFEILGHIQSLKRVVEGIKYHHERPDGKGYPYGIKGRMVPLIAQIISVADTFDAMISHRSYRKGLSPMTAYEEIIKHKGSQFASAVVDAFDRAFRKTKMYRPKYKKKIASS